MRSMALLLVLICWPASHVAAETVSEQPGPSSAALPTPVPAVCPAHCTPAAEPAAAAAERVDLNAADESALLELPGIGPARARAILAFRESHGAFRSLSQLLAIKGIGRSLLKQLRPLVKL